MNHRLLLLVFALAMALVCPSKAKADVSFSYFYEQLEPYGEWMEVGELGYCWRPTGVDPDWSPYLDGYWVYTDAGWTWVSYEEFGGITYHYGRWTLIENLGWVWKPGYVWGPAWVSWRANRDVVGWAPLPAEPEERLSYDSSVDYELGIGPEYYRFCPVEELGSRNLRTVLYPRRQNVYWYDNTDNITEIGAWGDSVYNYGPDYKALTPRVRIEWLRLERRYEPGILHYRPAGGTLIIFAPRIRRDHWRPRHVKHRWANVRIDRGWGSVRDREERRRMENRIIEKARRDAEKKARKKHEDRDKARWERERREREEQERKERARREQQQRWERERREQEQRRERERREEREKWERERREREERDRRERARREQEQRRERERREHRSERRDDRRDDRRDERKKDERRKGERKKDRGDRKERRDDRRENREEKRKDHREKRKDDRRKEERKRDR